MTVHEHGLIETLRRPRSGLRTGHGGVRRQIETRTGSWTQFAAGRPHHDASAGHRRAGRDPTRKGQGAEPVHSTLVRVVAVDNVSTGFPKRPTGCLKVLAMNKVGDHARH